MAGSAAGYARSPLVRFLNKLGQIQEFVKSSIEAAHFDYQWLVDVHNPVDASVSQRLLDASRVIFVGDDVIKDLGIGKLRRAPVGTALAGQIVDSVMSLEVDP
jgi:hypothetical protein